jgi:predicted hydrocarbon binding protein
MPPPIRAYFVMRIAGKMVRTTYRGSRALVRWNKGKGLVDLRGSIFCEVRECTSEPMCDFYVAAIRRLMQLFDVNVEIGTEGCRAMGATQCLFAVTVRPAEVTA